VSALAGLRRGRNTEKRPRSEHTRQWSPKDGVWLAGWMKYQMFWPLLVLLGLNLFWYFLILRIAKRYVAACGSRSNVLSDRIHRALLDSTLEDERSDDEGDGAEDDEKEE
jgi:acyl-CoA-dependent ceramide synthase